MNDDLIIAYKKIRYLHELLSDIYNDTDDEEVKQKIDKYLEDETK